MGSYSRPAPGLVPNHLYNDTPPANVPTEEIPSKPVPKLKPKYPAPTRASVAATAPAAAPVQTSTAHLPSPPARTL